MKHYLLSALKYPLDVKCRTCGKKRGNHHASNSACPLGRIQQFQQFHKEDTFKPRLPKLPKAVLAATEPAVFGGHLNEVEEHRRWTLYNAIAEALLSGGQPKPPKFTI